MNTEIPKIFEDNKNIRLDVLARISDGQFVQIEIQSQDTGELPEKAIQSISNADSEEYLRRNSAVQKQGSVAA